ncbi:TlpA disulfide reductase family protein [Kitasatospora sp. NPDC002227]|uniref:TlpA family protein disulfide reductase n=1 Tax=Kitasatospora sp. NPDC002227 TaxID=3154773 RepID=UPI00332A9019
MPYLTAAVVLVAVACAANLLLTFGVIRRLRAGTPEAAGPSGFPMAPQLAVGAEIPAFTATSTDGQEITLDGLLGRPTLVGLFSTACDTCRDQAPEFVAHATSAHGDDRNVIALVQGPAEDAGDLIAALGGAARVIVEPLDGPFSKAFQARTFPTVYELGVDGRVAHAQLGVGRLPAPVGA